MSTYDGYNTCAVATDDLSMYTDLVDDSIVPKPMVLVRTASVDAGLHLKAAADKLRRSGNNSGRSPSLRWSINSVDVDLESPDAAMDLIRQMKAQLDNNRELHESSSPVSARSDDSDTDDAQADDQFGSLSVRQSIARHAEHMRIEFERLQSVGDDLENLFNYFSSGEEGNNGPQSVADAICSAPPLPARHSLPAAQLLPPPVPARRHSVGLTRAQRVAVANMELNLAAPTAEEFNASIETTSTPSKVSVANMKLRWESQSSLSSSAVITSLPPSAERASFSSLLSGWQSRIAKLNETSVKLVPTPRRQLLWVPMCDPAEKIAAPNANIGKRVKRQAPLPPTSKVAFSAQEPIAPVASPRPVLASTPNVKRQAPLPPAPQDAPAFQPLRLTMPDRFVSLSPVLMSTTPPRVKRQAPLPPVQLSLCTVDTPTSSSTRRCLLSQFSLTEDATPLTIDASEASPCAKELIKVFNDRSMNNSSASPAQLPRTPLSADRLAVFSGATPKVFNTSSTILSTPLRTKMLANRFEQPQDSGIWTSFASQSTLPRTPLSAEHLTPFNGTATGIPKHLCTPLATNQHQSAAFTKPLPNVAITPLKRPTPSSNNGAIFNLMTVNTARQPMVPMAKLLESPVAMFMPKNIGLPKTTLVIEAPSIIPPVQRSPEKITDFQASRRHLEEFCNRSLGQLQQPQSNASTNTTITTVAPVTMRPKSQQSIDFLAAQQYLEEFFKRKFAKAEQQLPAVAAAEVVDDCPTGPRSRTMIRRSAIFDELINALRNRGETIVSKVVRFEPSIRSPLRTRKLVSPDASPQPLSPMRRNPNSVFNDQQPELPFEMVDIVEPIEVIAQLDTAEDVVATVPGGYKSAPVKTCVCKSCNQRQKHFMQFRKRDASIEVPTSKASELVETDSDHNCACTTCNMRQDHVHPRPKLNRSDESFNSSDHNIDLPDSTDCESMDFSFDPTFSSDSSDSDDDGGEDDDGAAVLQDPLAVAPAQPATVDQQTITESAEFRRMEQFQPQLAAIAEVQSEMADESPVGERANASENTDQSVDIATASAASAPMQSTSDMIDAIEAPLADSVMSGPPVNSVNMALPEENIDQSDVTDVTVIAATAPEPVPRQRHIFPDAPRHHTDALDNNHAQKIFELAHNTLDGLFRGATSANHVYRTSIDLTMTDSGRPGNQFKLAMNASFSSMALEPTSQHNINTANTQNPPHDDQLNSPRSNEPDTSFGPGQTAPATIARASLDSNTSQTAPTTTQSASTQTEPVIHTVAMTSVYPPELYDPLDEYAAPKTTASKSQHKLLPAAPWGDMYDSDYTEYTLDSDSDSDDDDGENDQPDAFLTNPTAHALMDRLIVTVPVVITQIDQTTTDDHHTHLIITTPFQLTANSNHAPDVYNGQFRTMLPIDNTWWPMLSDPAEDPSDRPEEMIGNRSFEVNVTIAIPISELWAAISGSETPTADDDHIADDTPAHVVTAPISIEIPMLEPLPHTFNSRMEVAARLPALMVSTDTPVGPQQPLRRSHLPEFAFVTDTDSDCECDCCNMQLEHTRRLVQYRQRDDTDVLPTSHSPLVDSDAPELPVNQQNDDDCLRRFSRAFSMWQFDENLELLSSSDDTDTSIDLPTTSNLNDSDDGSDSADDGGVLHQLAPSTDSSDSDACIDASASSDTDANDDYAAPDRPASDGQQVVQQSRLRTELLDYYYYTSPVLRVPMLLTPDNRDHIIELIQSSASDSEYEYDRIDSPASPVARLPTFAEEVEQLMAELYATPADAPQIVHVASWSAAHVGATYRSPRQQCIPRIKQSTGRRRC